MKGNNMKKLFVALLLAVPALAGAQARVYTVPTSQALLTPSGSDVWNDVAPQVAIDGDSLIVAADAALLYRRDSNGHWNYSRTLIPAGTTGARLVAMKNFQAIIKMGSTSTIWEKVNGNWQQAQTAAPITAPGEFAISTNRILVGGDGCSADALIYQKNGTTGIWDVTGRVPAEDGHCDAATPRKVDLNYDDAIVRGTGNVLRTYRRNGSALVWPNAGNIALTGTATSPYWSPAIQSGTLVLGDQSYYRRTSGGWTKVGTLLPRDRFYGAGDGGNPIYRDNLLMITDGVDDYLAARVPYVYAKNAQGGFDHVGVLGGSTTGPSTTDYAFAGNTAATVTVFDRGAIWYYIDVYTLPTTFLKPRAIANNFDARDVSDLETSAGSQYSIAGNSYNYLYRQSNLVDETSAVVNGSDWTDYQSVEADLKLNAAAFPEAWLGFAARYSDADNYYFVTVGADDVIRLKRKQNGVVTTLAERSFDVIGHTWYHLKLVADQTGVRVYFDGAGVFLSSDDTSLKHGRAALLTRGARADFDNLVVAPTGSYTTYDEAFTGMRSDWVHVGGSWNYSSLGGFTQDDTSGQALAINGVPMDDQQAQAAVTVNSFATTNPVAWAGVIARYVDANNFYYASLRSSNQLQIRKVVNGVTTVLQAVNYTVVPGETYRVALRVIGNELTATIQTGYDDAVTTVTARALDGDIAKGRFGVGTYRSAARFSGVSECQP
jgi:hypothetical protein